jgi:ribosomal protein S14
MSFTQELRKPARTMRDAERCECGREAGYAADAPV